jgi:hypothetical protein
MGDPQIGPMFAMAVRLSGLGALLDGGDTAAVLAQGDAYGIAAIRAHDPAFDPQSFLAQLQGTVLLVKRAIDEQNPALDRQVCADALWSAQRQQLASDQAAGQRRHIEGVRVDDSRVVAASSDATYDTIGVRVPYAARAYTVNNRGKVVDGDRKKARNFVETWWLQRSSQAATTAAGTLSQTCPRCGAPLQLGADGACPYCHTQLSNGAHDWVVVRIEHEGLEAQQATAWSGTSSGRNVGCIVGGIIGAVCGTAGIVIAIIAVVAGAKGSSTPPRNTSAAAAVSSANAAISSALSSVGHLPVVIPTVAAPPTEAGPSHLEVHLTSSNPLHITGTGTVGVADDPRSCQVRAQAKDTLPPYYRVTFNDGAAASFDLHITSVAGPVPPGVYHLTAADFSVALTGSSDDDTFVPQAGAVLTLTVQADGSGRLDFSGVKGANHPDALVGEMDWTCVPGAAA